jgi:hypothetical protein
MSTFLSILRSLMARKRYITAVELQESTHQFYFWFLFAQLFLTTSLSSGLVPVLAALAKNGILMLPRILAQNLPLASTYFVSYNIIEAITLCASTLMRLPALVRLFATDRNCQTPRDQVDQLYRLHDSIVWGELYPRFTMVANIGISPSRNECAPLISTLGLIYALLAPLILVTSALGFILTLFAFRYVLLYTAYIQTDTYGAAYLTAMFNLFWGLLVSEVCTLGLFILKIESSGLIHDIGQIAVLCVTLFCSIRYIALLTSLYRPFVKFHRNIRENTTVRERFRRRVPFSQAIDSPQRRATTIWLPRDSLGVSQAVATSILENIYGANEIFSVVTRGSKVTKDGQVILEYNSQDISDSLIEDYI